MSYANLAGSLGTKPAPEWSPKAVYNGNLNCWSVPIADMKARGEMEAGEVVLIRDVDGVSIRRGGEHDAAIANGLYFARKGGLSLHRDGSWSASLLSPSVAKPGPGEPKPGREAFTGLWDSLADLLAAIS